MRRILRTLTASLLLAACTTAEAPLPRARMAEVLRDIHLAEAWAGIVGPDSLRTPASRRNLDTLACDYHRIFKKHNISQTQFSEAYAWYKARPGELDSVYARVLPMLNEMEAKAASSGPKE